MKQEFSQMAFDFPLAEEPKAPPQNGFASRHKEPHNGLGLSEEEQHTVREEGRRAGVVVKIKSLKRVEKEPIAEPVAVRESVAILEKAPEKVFVQAAIPLEEIELPVVLVEPIAGQVAIAEPIKKPKPAPVEKTKAAPVEKVKSKRGRKSLKQITAEADLIEIPEDEVLFTKQYYTMGEVAEMFRVNQSLLRFWETEFNILQPRKNKKGDRYFRPIDIKNLHLIYHLLRQRKYTIEGAKEFLRKNKKADQRFEAINRLQQIKAFLLELKAQL